MFQIGTKAYIRRPYHHVENILTLYSGVKFGVYAV